MKKILTMVLVFSLVMALGLVSAFAATYDAFADFSLESNSGVWQYVYSNDQGNTFEAMSVPSKVDWGKYWYAYEGSYAGAGINNDANDKLELNTSDNNAEIAGLAFVAPEDGDYTFKGTVKNIWVQTSDKVYIKKGSEVLFEGVLPVGDSDNEGVLELDKTFTLKKGDTLVLYATTTSGWLSAYVNLKVAGPGAAEATDNPVTGDFTSVYAMGAIALISLLGLVIFRKRARA